MSDLILGIEEIRKIIDTIEVEALKIGFMYIFTAAADVSEVWGHCTPSKKDIFRVIYDIEGEKIPAIIFKIKEVRSNNKFRIVSIPENSKYDPWAKHIHDWMQKQDREYPFHYKEGEKALRTYTSEPIKLARKLFKDFKGYSKLYSSSNAFFNTPTPGLTKPSPTIEPSYPNGPVDLPKKPMQNSSAVPHALKSQSTVTAEEQKNV